MSSLGSSTLLLFFAAQPIFYIMTSVAFRVVKLFLKITKGLAIVPYTVRMLWLDVDHLKSS